MTPPDLTWIGDRLVVLSVSGGKDSAATSLYLRELGIEHERVFADTGWEHADTYRYLREVLAPRLGPITEVRGPKTLPQLARHKGMFPSRGRRFCTTELKVKPIKAHLDARRDATGRDVLNVVGIRAEESAARAAMPEREWADLPPNPLYLRGARRVGCWPCVFAAKAEIRLVADTDPTRIDEIRALEAEVEVAARARATAAGTTLEAKGHHAPTFFTAPDVAAARETSRCWPVDRMVEWSRTPGRGPAPASGCVRWGLCEGTQGSLFGEGP